MNGIRFQAASHLLQDANHTTVMAIEGVSRSGREPEFRDAPVSFRQRAPNGVVVSSCGLLALVNAARSPLAFATVSAASCAGLEWRTIVDHTGILTSPLSEICAVRIRIAESRLWLSSSSSPMSATTPP